MSLFTIGEGFVVLLVTRQGLPTELYDLAALEDATAWGIFRRVTLPLMAPILLLLLARDTIFSLQATFVPALVVTDGGPPQYATTYVPLFVYQNAFEYLRYGGVDNHAHLQRFVAETGSKIKGFTPRWRSCSATWSKRAFWSGRASAIFRRASLPIPRLIQRRAWSAARCPSSFPACQRKLAGWVRLLGPGWKASRLPTRISENRLDACC
jgi:hypothetical protein